MSVVKVLPSFFCLFYLTQLCLSQRHELLYNLVTINTTNLSINNDCKFDLRLVNDGIRNNEIWAKKCRFLAIDSFYSKSI